MANRPKIDWGNLQSPDTQDALKLTESLARDGWDNKDIAKKLGYAVSYFSTLINKGNSELSKALKRGRQPLEMNVENSLYRRAVGLVKVKTQVRRFLERKCTICEGGDAKCPICKGTGREVVTDMELVQETISELPPDVGAAAFWLKQKKSDIWNRQPTKTEITGKDGAPLVPEPILVELIDSRDKVDAKDTNN